MDKNKIEQKNYNKKLIKQTFNCKFKNMSKKSLKIKDTLIELVFLFLGFVLSDWFCTFVKIENIFYECIAFIIFCALSIIIARVVVNLFDTKK